MLFSVKDKDLLGYNNQYIGEAFMHFSDIPDTDTPLNSLPQIQLKLGRPTSLSMWCYHHYELSIVIYYELSSFL